MAKIIGVLFSDIQIEDWLQHNQNHHRLYAHTIALEQVSKQCEKYGVPAFFCGDLFDNPKALKNIVLEFFIENYQKLFEKKGITVVAISGNHDQSESNTLDHESPNYIRTFSRVFKTLTNLDRAFTEIDGVTYFGIPYFKNEKGFTEQLKVFIKYIKREKLTRTVLMVHRDLWGAEEPSGYLRDEIEDIPRNLDKYFKYFNLVIAGHIHKPQRIGRKVYMLGATGHQRTSDMNCEMGYWLMHDNFKLKFKPLKMPKFKYGTEPDGFNLILPPVQEAIVSSGREVHGFRKLTPKQLTIDYARELGLKKADPKVKLLYSYLKKAK